MDMLDKAEVSRAAQPIATARSEPPYLRTKLPSPHAARGRRLIARYPAVKALMGNNPWTFAIILGLVAGQTGMSWYLADAPWWVIPVVAFVVGSVANHALFVATHECAHRLVFKSRGANRAAGIVANLVQVFPSSIMFERHHLNHHSALGVRYLDPDLPSWLEWRLFAGGVIGRAVWIAIMPLMQGMRPLGLKKGYGFDPWLWANMIIVIGFDVAILWFWGWGALVYLTLSTIFSIGGLHPLSARWIQEHFLADDSGHETFSYYGLANRFDLNMGLHNEHHDLSTVTWNKLPEITRIAPEFYDDVASHGSYTRLLYDFVVKGRPAFTARMTRVQKARL